MRHEGRHVLPAAASFGIGTTGFVVTGLPPDVSRDPRVTIPFAGMLVSNYALGMAVGSPVMAVAFARLPHRTSLLALMALSLAGVKSPARWRPATAR